MGEVNIEMTETREFQRQVYLDGVSAWPVDEVRKMALEVSRYLIAIEGAVTVDLWRYVDRAQREGAYACLRALTETPVLGETQRALSQQ